MQIFRTWFEPLVPLRIEDSQLTVQVPSQFFYDWLEEYYFTLINDTITQVLGDNAKLVYSVAAPANPEEYFEPAVSISPSKQEVSPSGYRRSTNNQKLPSIDSCLNSRYTFDNYIKGDSNQLARAAAMAVANNPGGTSFNPLVIYGGVGLGKTHLIQAIGNYALANKTAKRILYVSSEKFTVDFVDSIQKDRVSDFSSFYRSVDLLIVDDIQFFSGKDRTQDIFFHTFNTLYQLRKQVVLSCDRPPKELKSLDERLISRFQWGLIADIQHPDLETRIAILQKKAEDNAMELPQDVIEYICLNVTSNIRELEGCLISLLARSSLENKEINIELAREVLTTVAATPKTNITIESVQRTVCDFYSIADDLLRAKTRKQEIVCARQVAMYLAKNLTGSSLKTIGLHFGGRDHSTVIHACQLIDNQLKSDDKFRIQLDHLKKKIEMVSR
jgi:chromosomal replication initiator protein